MVLLSKKKMGSLSVSRGSTLVFFVNGKKIVEENPNPEWTLLFYLRTKLGVRGPKEGCGEGGCGACTVMLSRLDRVSKHISHYSVNACLTPVVSVHGLSVVTTEGIGTTRSRLHPVQERLAKSHGSQCGFCTPGFVMSMYSLLRNCDHPTLEEIEENLAGNLCRCTGYRPILEGFASFSAESFRSGYGAEECCRSEGKEKSEQPKSPPLYDVTLFTPLDPSQEIIFPPELMMENRYDAEELCFPGRRTTWRRPATLENLLEIRSSYPEAVIVIGNTEVGIMRKNKNIVPAVQIDPSKVEDLYHVSVCKSGVILGAALSLTKVEIELKKVVQNLPEWKTRSVRSVLEMLRWFGSKQIKNTASLGGNIMTCSPVSDLNPVLLSVEAQLKFRSKNETRKFTLDSSFFAGYRKTKSEHSEVLIDIFIPFTDKDMYVECFKQSRRRADDVAIVNAGFKVVFLPGTRRVDRAIFAFGGMAKTTVVAPKVMQIVQGKEWNESLLEESLTLLLEDLPLVSSAPGGMVQYRRTLSLSFFFKFFMSVNRSLSSADSNLENNEDQNEQTLTPMIHRLPAQGYQSFETANSGPIGAPIVHSSAYKHATGEAAFVDDLPKQEKEISGALVLSEKASAKILHFDLEDASNVEGFLGFYCAKDIEGDQNKTGIVEEDEEVFASKEVKYAGEVIGIVVAESSLAAKEAARRIVVSYEEKDPLLTIESALKANSVWPTRRVQSGDVEEGFKMADHTLEGEIRVGGQEHFYMEPQTSLVIPLEAGDVEVWSATQNPTETQRNVAKALGLPMNKVVCRTRRLGGGFGGKEIKSGRIATYAAVAAVKTGRPVRLTLDRDVDIRTTGGRHPMLARWKAGFNSDGSLVALDLRMFANGGYSLDCSDAMAVKAILHADNVYRIPNTDIRCTCCRTNLASNTACRGTGAPQSMLIMEDIVTRVSAFLRTPPHQIRSLNMYQTSNPVTHYGQTLTHCTVRSCWGEVLLQSDFYRRRQEVAQFNSKNAFTKRGISAVPSKMAVSFGCRMLEQAGAVVLIYKDGSVLLSHGGVEMGQGLHTKMIQIVAKEFGLPVEKVNLMETSTDKVPNTTPSAASSSSDLNGMAVKAACQQLLERLEPYKKRNPDGGWGDWVMAAYEDRVSLLGTGFYKTPGLLDFDFDKRNFGDHFTYFTFGAAVTEVEVDILTGNHTVLQTDIVMDAGQSLNPAVDIGQIEGAFLFGYGLYTLEEMLYDPQGKLLTQGPNTYKLPSIQDIPCKFNVSLLKGSSNPRAIYSSRGVGEPPLFLASSAFFAIKDAISSAIPSTDTGANFQLDSPATAERIRMATQDRFSKMVKDSTSECSLEEAWCIRV